MYEVIDTIFFICELGVRVAKDLIALIVTAGVVKMFLDVRKDGGEK